MKNWIIILFTFFFLAGCTSTKSISKSFDSSSTKGIFFGTITFPKTKSKMENFSLFYRLKGAEDDKKYKQNIYVKNVQKNPFTQYVKFSAEKETTDEYIYSFAFEVSPGNYEFYQLEKSLLNAAGSVNFTSSEFSINYEVKSGKPTYVGDYKFYEDGNDNGALIEISNDRKKAIELLTDEFQNINWSESLSDVPAISNNNIIEIK
ncbi:hypothetical protein AAU57_11510 [Nonlabens sp. YIK11]|uniref:hypothetical protein n=1 Tax=Nonlabens sp. YIK11 TaxID=1453349 RepID=UPI0007084C6D|nr:hypothetical protein [Nonlabens sp. YIK11]KQC33886.1 hypothetical protein AAU57_11510 [Nonlabens sp. YIK11]